MVVGGVEILQMEHCDVDQAVFYLRDGDNVIVIVIHGIDNLTIATSSVVLMEHVKEELKKDFKLSDMGELHWILRFEVKRDREKRILSLSQAAYIHAVLERFGFENLKPYATPMDPNCRLSSNDSPKMVQEFATMKDKPYWETIGSGQYALCGTRLDIMYIVSTLSRYLENPGPAHWTAVKHLFGYLNDTVDWELMYGQVTKDLEGYADADGSMHED